MAKDKELVPGFDVQVIPVSAGGAPVATQAGAPMGTPSMGNGYVVMPLPNATVVAVPPQPAAPPAPAQPSLVVITLSPKKEEDKKEKKSSSVFQRL
jgi:hypothetical protein